MDCPMCGHTLTCDFVDIGVGQQQCSPWHCESCGYTEREEDQLVILEKAGGEP